MSSSLQQALCASLSKRFPSTAANQGDSSGLTIGTLKDVERGSSAVVVLCVDLTEVVLAEAIAAHAKIAGVAPGDYDRRALKNTTITDSSARSWTYQYCTQYGWFQTPSKFSHGSVNSTAMRPQILNLTYWTDLCQELFETPLKINRSILEFAKNRVHGTNIVFTNGVEDPWRWATNQHLYIPELGQKALLADCDDCGHCAELYTPKESDPKSLKEVRYRVYLQVSGWLKGHREQSQSSLEEIMSYRVKDHFESSLKDEQASSQFL